MKFIKNSQMGKVSATVFAILGVAALFMVVLFSWVGAHNRANGFERDLEKAYEGSQITLSSCTTDIRNIAKIPEQYFKQLESLVKTEMEGRYGGTSTDRVAIFVQEHSKNLDSSMLRNVQNRISSCETKFSQEQKLFVEIRQEYRKALGTFWGGTFMGLSGFPKIDVNQFKAILDKSTRTQFESGERQDYDLNIKKD